MWRTQEEPKLLTTMRNALHVRLSLDEQNLWSGLKRCFKFSGRASRAEFLRITLVYTILLVVACIAFNAAVESAKSLRLALALLVFFCPIPIISASVRRLHDMGRSIWWWLLVVIPYVGWIIFLILLLFKSQEAQNKYGAGPLPPA